MRIYQHEFISIIPAHDTHKQSAVHKGTHMETQNNQIWVKIYMKYGIWNKYVNNMKKGIYKIKWHPLQLNNRTFTIIKQILGTYETENKYKN